MGINVSNGNNNGLLERSRRILFSSVPILSVYSVDTQPPDTFVLDGTQTTYAYYPPSETHIRFWYCKGEGACQGGNETAGLGPSQPVGWNEQMTTVIFNGGEVTLQLFIAPHFYSTEPAVFPAAWGNIDGIDF